MEGVAGRGADGGGSDGGKAVLGSGRDRGETGSVRAIGPGTDAGATGKGWTSGARGALSRSHRITSVRVEDSMAPVMV
jgi:hypothetical protein